MTTRITKMMSFVEKVESGYIDPILQGQEEKERARASTAVIVKEQKEDGVSLHQFLIIEPCQTHQEEEPLARRLSGYRY